MEEDLIQEQIEKAIDSDGNAFGMTYEQGVRYASEWVLNGCPINELPIDED